MLKGTFQFLGYPECLSPLSYSTIRQSTLGIPCHVFLRVKFQKSVPVIFDNNLLGRGA